jgi:hypothetical protein
MVFLAPIRALHQPRNSPMTNVVSFPKPDPRPGYHADILAVTRKLATELTEWKERALNRRSTEADREKLCDIDSQIILLRDRTIEKGRRLGLSQADIDEVLVHLDPVRKHMLDQIRIMLKVGPPPPPIKPFLDAPVEKSNVMSWDHPVGATLGIISILVILFVGMSTGFKPYFWAGMHNGGFSHGYGIRSGHSHHRN